MNSTGVGFGSIILGLLIVMALATAVYIFGVWAISRFRHGRVEEESTVSYPDQPQGTDDQRAVAQSQRKEPAPLEQAVGAGRRIVSQTPDRIGERPVDADHDRGVAPRDDNRGSGGAPGGGAPGGSNPL
jgi:hypothetical protein